MPQYNAPDVSSISDEKRDKMLSVEDHEFVNRLWSGDNDAWQLIFTKVVLPVIACGKSPQGIAYSTIMRDRGMAASEIHTELFLEMIERKKLANFKFRCPVIYWMRFYVSKLILDYCKKNPVMLSEEKLGAVFTSEDSKKENEEISRLSISELWKQNPLKAYVFILKLQKIFSSEDIKNCLGISSTANVDQLYARAKNDLRNLVKHYSGDDK